MKAKEYLEELELYNLILNELTDPEKISYVKEKIIETKRKYRARLKEECADKYLYPYNKKGKIVACSSNNDWETFWRKVFFEGEHWDEEDKEAFRDDNWIEINSPYDCTGKTFTWAIDSFNVPNGVVAYIRYAIDV